MKGFLYYLPGGPPAPKVEDLEAAGLGYAFERKGSAAIATRGVHGGPDDGQGTLVAAVVGDDRLIGYDAGKQTWRKIPDKEVWVGFDKERPPTPADLVRHDVLDGHEVELGDGNRWLIPVARGQAENDAGDLGWYQVLPQSVAVDDAGEWVLGEVLPRYQWLWKLAQEWTDAWWGAYFPDPEREDNDGDDSESVELTVSAKLFDLAQLADGATAVLSANYRVGKAEVSMLGLFDGQQPMREILGALIDWPFVQEWFKKKEAALRAESAFTDDGPPADTPATDPA